MLELQTIPLRFRVWDKKEKCFVKSLRDFRLYLDDSFHYDTTGQLYFVENGQFIISQDIGLKDKNGKSIYTGDIVKWGEVVGVIEYASGMVGVRFEPHENSITGWLTVDDFSTLPKIIGNIWQNPELREKLNDSEL